MQKIFKLKSFWIVFALAVFSVFIGTLNTGRVYRSETDILVIPKSVVAVKNSDQILENLSKLPTMLSFYEKVTNANENVIDATVSELPDYKKKIFWNSELHVERTAGSGILKIITTDKTSYQAEELNKQATETLIGTVGLYYDIKTDLDLRIVDPVITSYDSEGLFNFNLFLIGLGISFLAILAIFFAFDFFPTQEKPLEFPIADIFARYKKSASPLFQRGTAPRELVVSEEEKAADEIIHQESLLPREEPTAPERSVVSFSKSASAPANLPIAQELPFAVQEEIFPESEDEKVLPEMKEEIKIVKTVETPSKIPLTHEATAEEVKERLNKLLSGKI